ncbi:MAG: iron ABC transporter permease [Okeania sp. SIO2G4]|uniref:ABC transporter permease n=1 Tax=unclassified Okeania TaxID=2634635 RepID=UPI0013B5CB49|nr:MULTISPECIES: iron ABC transporter permease [unclassified Okeania]NEP05099.1 iron ABC transporter permease [Okeania sp. SIO4D6]NEP38962.1 iron ABC transporter permease [Okeania sp. SIO2H7]NEP71247.1 iron ABC transporter permease [Okeania sp. SIO2G5]NEP92161.1 iron ABC transporter permease [Okeania sp. SIO2F5]NEQ90190.1 iron ABC transporter permease [Okeania sp. SIO2G4]
MFDNVKKINYFNWNAWTVFVIAIALLISAPVVFILSSIFSDTGEIWSHLASTVLPRYLLNSLILMLGVGCGVVVIGVGVAWLVTMCRFPGSRIFEWAMLLPLATPAYILAYTYTELLEFYGPVQMWLREVFGWASVSDYWFPEIRSMGGAIALLTLTLYPYVYLLTRVAFLEQSTCTLEASRSLGCNPWRSFYKIALPLARPAIMAGLALALMETLNDFGTVQYFGVETFTTGIYRTWFGMGERVAAAQLAAVLMLFILWLILLELWSRRQAKYYQTSSQYQKLQQFHLGGMRGIVSLFACLLPVLLGFLLPAGLLLEMTIAESGESFRGQFWNYASHSLILAGVTAVLAVAIALIMAYGVRLNRNLGMRLSTRIAAMGYAVPGSVIAVGILIPIGAVDNIIDSFMRSIFGISTGLLFSGTITALVFAYLVRFMAVAFGAVESSLLKIKPSLDDASRSLGYGATKTLVKVHAPMMWGGLLTGAMLTFVDVMKELPATMVIRPFNFDTLAVRVYNLASDERLTEAAGPALAIVLVGIIPVILLSLRIAKSRQY